MNDKLKNALIYANENPDSEFAFELRKRIQNGEFNAELKRNGVDVSGFGKKEKKSFVSKIGSALIQNEKNFGESIAGAAIPYLGSIGGQTQFDRARDTQQGAIDALTKRIQEKKANGEDTTRLVKVLKDMTSTPTMSETDFNPALNKSSRQVLGEALGVATDIAGFGTYGKGFKTLSMTKALPSTLGAVGTGSAKTFISGALKGATTGLVSGATFGGLQGASRGLQNNQKGSSLAASTIGGAVIGGALGGVVGGVTGGVSGFVQGKKDKAANFTKELVTPKLSAKEKAEAISQGRLVDQGLFKKAELQYSKRDELVASAVDDYVSPKSSVGENISSIKDGITTINDGVKKYIETNKVPFNYNQLRTQLNSGKDDLKLVFASDDLAEKTYDAVTDAFIEKVNKGDTLSLFNARQSFDQVPAVKKLLSSDKLGENVKREVVLAVRRSANEYIASLLPKGNQYRDLLMKESLMIEAIENISQKSADKIGKTAIQQLVKSNPVLKYVITSAVGGGILGSLLNGAIKNE